MFVGRLGREKGAHVLVEAWRRWGPGAPLLEMAGDGPERPALESLVRAAGLEGRVRFSGQVAPSEVERRLGLARLLVVPSLCFEGFPLVIREAFAGVCQWLPPASGRWLPSWRTGGPACSSRPATPPICNAASPRPGRTGCARRHGLAARAAFDATLTADRSYQAC
jgi:glycosyltransferase involved in cell wall biosynthesis